MSHLKFVVLLTHPKLAMLALPLSTCRVERGDVRSRTWGESRIKYDNKLDSLTYRLFCYNYSAALPPGIKVNKVFIMRAKRATKVKKKGNKVSKLSDRWLILNSNGISTVER